jgi:ABC-type amino acid transport substrate-binding protein
MTARSGAFGNGSSPLYVCNTGGIWMLIRQSIYCIGWTFILVVGLISLAAAAPSALTRAKENGRLIVCADPYNLPFSSPDPGMPGFDLEIAKEIATGLGVQIGYFWADTGTRGGLGRALRRSIQAKECDFFPGLPSGADALEEYAEKRLRLTQPYLGTGFVLVRRKDKPNIRKLEDLKGMRIAVSMVSVADSYLFYHGYTRGLYRLTQQALEGMQKGEADVGLLWAPTVGWWLQQHPDSVVEIVKDYVPIPEMQSTLAIAVRQEDTDLLAAIDTQLERLRRDGRIQEIVTKYGLPFYPPFQ